MIILTLRTDKPEAEIGLYEDAKKLEYVTWTAHRELAETLHRKIQGILEASDVTLEAIQGIVCFKGPGSFTGLRIGLTVANSLSYAVGAKIVSDMSESWREKGIARLVAGDDEKTALPEYGAVAHITKPKCQ